MTDIQDSEYFFHGSAAEDGSQYGLYEPITDRIIMTSRFPNALETVAFLFFGRYNFYVIKLSTADNFQPNLIDNLCCTNWTIANKSDIRANADIRKLHEEKTVIPVKSLVQVGPIDHNELVYKDIEYLMAAYYWTTTEERELKISHFEPFSKTELSIQSFLTLPVPLSGTNDAVRKMHDIIFTEYDFATAKRQIDEIIKWGQTL